MVQEITTTTFKVSTPYILEVRKFSKLVFTGFVSFYPGSTTRLVLSSEIPVNSKEWQEELLALESLKEYVEQSPDFRRINGSIQIPLPVKHYRDKIKNMDSIVNAILRGL